MVEPLKIGNQRVVHLGGIRASITTTTDGGTTEIEVEGIEGLLPAINFDGAGDDVFVALADWVNAAEKARTVS